MSQIGRLYGEARALIQGCTPSQEVFFELCELVEQAWNEDPEQTMAEFFPFIDAALSQWPDEVRTCPPFWEDHFRTKRHYEAYEPLKLIRRLVFGETSWNPTRIRAFGSSQLAPSIRHLTLLPHRSGTPARLEKLCEAPGFGFVRELHIEEEPEKHDLHGWLPLLLDWPAKRGTTMLKLHHYRQHPREELEDMSKFSQHFPALEQFWLMHTRLGGETLAQMLSGKELVDLREIQQGYSDIRGGLSVNLQDGVLYLQHASKSEILLLFGSRWIARITELKLKTCHLFDEDVERAFGDMLARSPDLTRLIIQRCQVSIRLAETIIAHKNDELEHLSGKKINFQRGAKEVLESANWERMQVFELE